MPEHIARFRRPWKGPTVVTIGLLAYSALLGLGGCGGRVDPADTLARTVELIVRNVCENASNCENRCPDGSSAQSPGYRC